MKYEISYRLFVEDTDADEPTLVMSHEYHETERVKAIKACDDIHDKYARVEKTTTKWLTIRDYRVDSSEVIHEN